MGILFRLKSGTVSISRFSPRPGQTVKANCAERSSRFENNVGKLLVLNLWEFKTKPVSRKKSSPQQLSQAESIHHRLARLRLENGLTAKSVAEAIGVPVTTYREWEYGRAIRGEPYQKLAQLFNVSLCELLTGEHNSPHSIETEIRKVIAELQALLIRIQS